MENLADAALDIVLSPALWLCILFGLIYGVLFTVWRGGGYRQLLRDIVTGVLGFGLGQVLASLLHLPTLQVGEVHLLWGSIFSVLSLLIGRRYWRPRRPAKAAPGAPAP
jgi:uncharacterized membrane protein YeaQ/YmgE (transglycosylase-associated protein family)